MSRRAILVVAVLLAFASGAFADKTLTYFTVTLADVDQLLFYRDAASPSGWGVRAHANVRGTGSGYSASVGANATAGQKTTIENFITNNVVPALNTQEGL